MAKKRATAHNGHVGGKMVHNDRTFAYWKAKHIDPKKTPFNIYVSYASGERIQFNEAEKQAEFYEHDEHGYIVCDDSGEAVVTEKGRRALFRQSMLEYYKAHYSDALEAQNEKHRARRQYKRVRKMEDVLKNTTTAPDECLIQIDNIRTRKDELITAEALQRVTERVIQEMNDWSAAHGNHLHVLNYAVHVDETSPHAHIKRVWDCVDDNGNLTIAQDKALEASGIERPNPNKRDDRDNNRKMTFDAMYREWVIKAFEAEGYEVEREPLPNTEHKSTKAYAREQFERLQELEIELDEREHEIIAKEQRADRRLTAANNKIKEADEQAEEIIQQAIQQANDRVTALNAQKESELEKEREAIEEEKKRLKEAMPSLERLQKVVDWYESEGKNKQASAIKKDIQIVSEASKPSVRKKLADNITKKVLSDSEEMEEKEARKKADRGYNL